MRTNQPETTIRESGSTQFVCRILIVDSNRQRSDCNLGLAKSMGHEVRRAHRGVTAVEIAKQFVPDVVLIDFSRPDAGIAVAAAIRRMRAARGAHIVALTDAMVVDELLVYEDSVDARLEMPLTADAVEQMLWRWCERVHGWGASMVPAC